MAGRDAVEGLADRLRACRERAGLSQTQAGERSGVHHIGIAQYETEKRVPTLAVLYKLAEAYGVNVCGLLPGGKLAAGEPGKPAAKGKGRARK